MLLSKLPRALWIVRIGASDRNDLVFTSRRAARDYKNRLQQNGYAQVRLFSASVTDVQPTR